MDVEGSNPFSRSNAGPSGPALLLVALWVRNVNASRVRGLRLRPNVYATPGAVAHHSESMRRWLKSLPPFGRDSR